MSKWVSEKPKFKESILITANRIRDNWEYTLFTIEKIECDNQWYWGLVCDDGEEWGDINELNAELYLQLPLIKKREP